MFTDSLCVSCENFQLNENASSLFTLSPKFVPTPTGCCHRDVLIGVRDFLRKYKWRTVLGACKNSSNRFNVRTGVEPSSKLVHPDVLRHCNSVFSAVTSLLRNCPSCYPSDNLSAAQRLELQRLSDDRSVVISPADKGGMWLITSVEEYDAESYRQLADTRFYQPIEEEMTQFTARRLRNFLDFLVKKRFLSRKESRALQPPSAPKDRLFYLIPKLHKETWSTTSMPPGRPIISDVDSVSRRCASLVEHFLAPVARSLPSYVRDSLDVIAKIDSLRVSDSTILFTMDISSLYTNVPTAEGLQAVSRAFLRHPDVKRPDLTILSILRLLLNSNDFVYRQERFLQVQGTAMGSAYGGSYASIFLGEWEGRICDRDLKPEFWIRFIDDVFGVWNHGEQELLNFCTYVNSLFPSIKVSLNLDFNLIRFLDLTLYKSGDRLLHRIGFKPTDSFTILSPSSYHPVHIFNGILFGQIYRWATRSATYKDFKDTKHVVQRHWRRQGYTRTRIRKIVKSVLNFTHQGPDTWETGFLPCDCLTCSFGFSTRCVNSPVTRDSYPIVHRITCKDVDIIYLIVCKKCDCKYVGETSRPLYRRISEHLCNIRSGYPTSVSKHFTSTCDLNDFSFTALEHCPSLCKRRRKEVNWINRLNTTSPAGMNETTEFDEGHINLVLPYSECSQRVGRLCSSLVRDLKVRSSFTTSANLRQLTRNHRQ